MTDRLKSQINKSYVYEGDKLTAVFTDNISIVPPIPPVGEPDPEPAVKLERWYALNLLGQDYDGNDMQNWFDIYSDEVGKGFGNCNHFWTKITYGENNEITFRRFPLTLLPCQDQNEHIWIEALFTANYITRLGTYVTLQDSSRQTVALFRVVSYE